MIDRIQLIEIPTGVQLCTLNERKISELWEKLKNFDRLFSDDIRWDREWFAKRMIDQKTITLETEGGLLILTNVHENHYAEAHVSFWDKRLSPRTELLKNCLVWAFLQFNLQRIEALIPEFSRALRRFMTERLGFQFEGRMRKRMLYKGQLTDVLMFSILKEEVL